MGLLGRKKEVTGFNPNEPLSQQEVTFILKTLHTCTFEGKDVLLLADVVNKLHSFLKSQ
jgi:hypothetical protein